MDLRLFEIEVLHEEMLVPDGRGDGIPHRGRARLVEPSDGHVRVRAPVPVATSELPCLDDVHMQLVVSWLDRSERSLILLDLRLRRLGRLLGERLTRALLLLRAHLIIGLGVMLEFA